MKVELKAHWFAPSQSRRPDRIRVMSGQRFRKGVHDSMPDYFFDELPKTAVVIKAPAGREDEVENGKRIPSAVVAEARKAGDYTGPECDDGIATQEMVEQIAAQDAARAASDAEAKILAEAEVARQAALDKQKASRDTKPSTKGEAKPSARRKAK